MYVCVRVYIYVFIPQTCVALRGSYLILKELRKWCPTSKLPLPPALPVAPSVAPSFASAARPQSYRCPQRCPQLRPQRLPALEATVAPSFASSFDPIIHVLGRRRYNFCWNPLLHFDGNIQRAYRKQSRPRSRWTDDFTKFASKEYDSDIISWEMLTNDEHFWQHFESKFSEKSESSSN